MASPDKKKDALFFILLAGAVALAAAEILIMIFYREMGVDEIFSAFKGYLALTGELVPYQNGIFDYPPLVIPTYGMAHYLFGPSMEAARVLSGAFFAAMLVFLFLTGRRLAGRWAGLAAVFLVLSNLLLVGNFIAATMYALSGFLLVLVVWIESSALSQKKKIFISSAIFALLFLARTNMIAAFLAYLVWLAFMRVPVRRVAGAAAVWVAITGLGYLPIFWFNPGLAFAHFFIVFAPVGPLAWLPPSLKVGGAGIQEFVNVLAGMVKEFYGFLLLFFLSAAAALAPERGRVASFLRKEPTYAFLLICCSLLIAAHYFYPRIVGNIGYANYFMPLTALSFAVAAGRFFSWQRIWVFLFAIALALNFFANLNRTDVISNPRAESDLARARRGAAFVRGHTAATDRVLTFDNSVIHVFLADRRTFFPLMSRNFLYMQSADTARVRSAGFYNLDMLKEWALRDADVLLLDKEKWNESFIRRPFFGAGDEDVQKQLADIRAIFEHNYEFVGAAWNVYPRKYTEGNDGGTLELYRRIK